MDSETPAIEQPGFLYLECPDCMFSRVVTAATVLPVECPVCYEDCWHEVAMASRIARADDRPEGADMRIVTA